MFTKQDILDKIKSTAGTNAGRPLGSARFETETGIKPYDWQRFWARFGDAQKEAGFEPNKFQDAHPTELLIEKAIGLMRKLGKFPTYNEMKVENNNNADFPGKTIFQRLGTKQQLAAQIAAYCRNKGTCDDILELCKPILKDVAQQDDSAGDDGGNETVGEVYLFKSGRYYKIGKTNDTVRRGSELRIQLPEKLDLIHSIKTDDPSGIESYWHKRFESKRMEGEWFDLKSPDVNAFKRWRRIY